MGKNVDIWKRVWKAAEDLGGWDEDLKIYWIPSHQKEKKQETYEQKQSRLGNDAADEEAVRACLAVMPKRDAQIRIDEARVCVKEYLEMCAKIVKEQEVEGRCDHNKKDGDAAWIDEPRRLHKQKH